MYVAGLLKSLVRCCCCFVDNANLERAIVIFSVGIVLDSDKIDTYPIGRFCISSTAPIELSSCIGERTFCLTFSFVFKYKCKSRL